MSIKVEINKKDYLKKYLSKDEKKKKKKKKVKALPGRVKIIDDDLDFQTFNQAAQEDLLAANEDAPQIVDIIDERPLELRMDEFKKGDEWTTFTVEDEIKNIKGENIKEEDRESDTETADYSHVQRTVSNSRVKFDLVKVKEENYSDDDNHDINKDDTITRNRNKSLSNRIRNDSNSPPRRRNEIYKSSEQNGYNNSPHRRRNVYNDEPAREKNKDDNDSPEKRNADQDNSPLRRDNDNNSSPRKRNDYNSPPRRCNDDISPPRRLNDDNSPPRRRNDDISPPRRLNDDISPPRRRNDDKSPQRNRNDDISPPRRRSDNKSPPRNCANDTDSSPPRKRKDDTRLPRSHSDDNNPPRKKVNNDRSSSRRDDISPPRRRNHSSSPSGNRNNSKNTSKHNNDNSPPRRKRNSNLSPQQNENKDTSPPRKKSTELRDYSPARRKSGNERNRSNSPHRKRYKEFSSGKDSSSNTNYRTNSVTKEKSSRSKKSRWESEDRDNKLTKTLDGKTAGLQNAKDLIKETQSFKKREEDLFKNMSLDVSGANAMPVMRDRKTGKVRDLEKEAEEKGKKAKEQEAIKEKYDRWGKGVKQVDDYNQKLKEQVYEMSKPLARYADDEDLEKYLKEQEREGDPMLAYIRKKKKKNIVASGKPLKPQYEGEFMPNRFGIRPGHKWDGVDRSNGYEKKWFEVQNSKLAQREEIYKWSTEDM